VGTLQSLIPVLQCQLEFHLFHERRQKAMVADDHLVDELQRSAVVVSLLEEFGLAKQSIDVPRAFSGKRNQKCIN
jgi:hypothetical protein